MEYDFRASSDVCVKCGKCKQSCTIFQINQDETTSARGFVDLLGEVQKETLELSKSTKSIFDTCFLCTNCVTDCPLDLPIDTMIQNIRFKAGVKFGISWYKKLFFYLLRNRRIMDMVAKFGYVFQSCAIKINKTNNTAVPRFYLPIVKSNRALPYAKKISFLNKYPENIKVNKTKAKAQKQLKNKVAIFIGCMSNYTYTNTGDSLVKILKKLDINILIPKKQLCCSAPAYFTGDFKSSEYLIKENIKYFETFINDVDNIISPEATCTAMINHDWEVFLTNLANEHKKNANDDISNEDKEWINRAKKITSKTILATKYLKDKTKLYKIMQNKKQNTKKEVKQKITYHDPCHSKKVQNVSKEPRDLLKNNYDIKEMSDSSKCCGFGGVTMQSENYHLAKKAGEPKAKMIDELNVEVVSAECSACRMQISNSLFLNKSKTIFKNPIELIADKL
jgi:glycolate oxidase iron-sulfur subunit